MDNQQARYKDAPQQAQSAATSHTHGAVAEKHPSRKEADGRCPKCGCENDASAVYCENCGAELRKSLCPNCQAPIEAGTDLCEACGTYVMADRCSFCSASLTEQDAFCPECGNSRGGIVCPVCHATSMFPFCPVCGTALTDSAHVEVEKVWSRQDKRQVSLLARELERLWMTLPARNARQRQMRERNQELRRRVLHLLEEDGVDLGLQPRPVEPIMDEEQLESVVASKTRQLQELLDKMAMPDEPTPAKARIYAMASKPGVSRLAWKCNFKNALHTSPLGCACPQKGGRWIVLGTKSLSGVQDDK